MNDGPNLFFSYTMTKGAFTVNFPLVHTTQCANGADVLLPRNPLDRTTSLKQDTESETVSVEPPISQSLIKYINEGEIQLMLAHTYPLRDLQAAQQLFIDKQHVGNIVVTMD